MKTCELCLREHQYKGEYCRECSRMYETEEQEVKDAVEEMVWASMDSGWAYEIPRSAEQ